MGGHKGADQVGQKVGGGGRQTYKHEGQGEQSVLADNVGEGHSGTQARANHAQAQEKLQQHSNPGAAQQAGQTGRGEAAGFVLAQF